jgi:hypothetical protein
MLQIGGAGQITPFQRQRADRGLHRSGRAERVAVQALRTADGDPFGMLAQCDANRTALGRVVQHGRGSMRVDIVDRVGRQASALDRFAHRAGGIRAVGMRRGHVMGIAGRSVAHELGVDVRTARLRVLE